MESRLEDLEIRIAHQEVAIDELTRQLCEQGKMLDTLKAQIHHLYSMMKDVSPSNVAPISEETPPPHY